MKSLKVILIYRFSVKPVESKYAIYGKVNLRLKHLTKLKTNTTKYESENILVSKSWISCLIYVDISANRNYYNLFLFYLFQCGNYGIGGEYLSHMDRTKLPKGDSRIGSPKYSGNRIVTSINVLEAPTAGK